MRVGLIGTGRIGAFHARILSSNARVTSLVVADVDATRAESVATEVGAETARDASDLARRVDAMVITTATDSHAELVQLAADARLPVFCEKPLSLELDITNQVIAHVDRAGISLQVGFQRRFDVGFAETRRLVASGQLDLEPLITAELPLNRLADAFSMLDRDATQMKVMIDCGGTT